MQSAVRKASKLLARYREALGLGVLIAGLSAAHLIWLARDDRPWPGLDSYTYLIKLLEFLGDFGTQALADPAATLKTLSFIGRPPLYQLLSAPFIAVFGGSEDAALAVNLLFTALLVVSTYGLAKLARNGSAGLLAALLVASYPPIVHLSRTYWPHSALPACVALSTWLLLAMLEHRSPKLAWLFCGSLLFGMMIHPLFAAAMAVPATVFSGYAVLFRAAPQPPGRDARPGAWLRSRGRDPFFLYGLLPGALVALAATLLWYLTLGQPLIATQKQLSTPELAEFRGAAVRVLGFEDVAADFWWYARTAPHALSIVLTFFVVLGLVSALVRRRLPALVLATSLVAGYVAFGLRTHYNWWYLAPLLPFAAGLSAVGIAGLRPPWLARGAAAVAVLAALFNYQVVSWGAPSWARGLAIAAGAPLDSYTCQRRSPMAFCEAPPVVEHWPIRDVLRALAGDPQCAQGAGCELMLVRREGLFPTAFDYYRLREFPQLSLRVTSERSRGAGILFPVSDLLTADWILYPVPEKPPRGSAYLAVAVRFLEAPPPAFAATHQPAADFDAPGGLTVRLLRRTRPLDREEVESVRAALDLPDAYKGGVEELLASLVMAGGDLDALLAFLDESGEAIDRTRRLRWLLDAGSRYREDGRIEPAIAVYRRAAALGPELAQPRVRLALALQAAGDVDGMIAELEKAVPLDARAVAPRRLLAAALRTRGELDRAIALCREALELDPEDVSVHVTLGRTLRDAGRLEEAASSFETAAALAPEAPAVRRLVAETRRAQGRFEAAIETYRSILQDHGDDAGTLLGLALANREAGRRPETFETLERAIALEPGNPRPRLVLARTSRRFGEIDRAIAAYREILELDPRNAEALAALETLAGRQPGR